MQRGTRTARQTATSEQIQIQDSEIRQRRKAKNSVKQPKGRGSAVEPRQRQTAKRPRQYRRVGTDFASAMYREDQFELELISPNGAGVYADWLKEHGPGLHHVKLKTEETYADVLDTAQRVSGRKPYLEIKWPDGTPIVAYADMLKETGLLLEVGYAAG